MGFNSVSIIHSCPGLGTLTLLAVAHLLADGNAGWERKKLCSQSNIVFIEYTDKILLGDTCVCGAEQHGGIWLLESGLLLDQLLQQQVWP